MIWSKKEENKKVYQEMIEAVSKTTSPTALFMITWVALVTARKARISKKQLKDLEQDGIVAYLGLPSGNK